MDTVVQFAGEANSDSQIGNLADLHSFPLCEST